MVLSRRNPRLLGILLLSGGAAVCATAVVFAKSDLLKAALVVAGVLLILVGMARLARS